MVQVDDEAPVQVVSVRPHLPNHPVSEPKKEATGKNYQKKTVENCGYCKKRGSPCVRHGGLDTQNYKGKAKDMKAEEKNVEWCTKCQAFTTHTAYNHPAEPVNTNPVPKVEPEFMPGHEKEGAELESWRPKPRLPGDKNYGRATRTDRENKQVIPDSKL